MSMFLVAILPFFLMALLILGVFVFGKKMIKFRGKFNLIKGRWILTIYMICLVASVFISFFIPETESTSFPKATEEDRKSLAIDLEGAAYEGKLDDISNLVKHKNKEISLKGKQLKIVSENEDFFMSIIIERIKTPSAKIDSTIYQTKSIFRGLDISNKLQPVSLTLEGDRLSIIGPSPIEMSIQNFSDEMTFSQFTDGGIFNYDTDTFETGNILLYLKVPEVIDVENETNFDMGYMPIK